MVVTAAPTTVSELDTPAAVSVVNGDEMRQAAPRVNLSESLGAVPGLQVQNRQNYAQDLQLSIRGFGSRSTYGVRGLRIYVDGIPATMPDGQGQTSNIDIGSVDSLEVLRGPFSALYGNSSGGVINVTSQTGSQPPTIEASSYYGSFGTWHYGESHRRRWRRQPRGRRGLHGIDQPLHHPRLSRSQRRAQKSGERQTGRAHQRRQ
jgi:iron complex outermembrane receptor protein